MKYFFLVATFAEVAPFPSCIATIVKKKKLSRHNNLKPTNTTLSQQETKKIENSQFIEKKKKKCFSLGVYRDFCFIHLRQGQSFQFLGTVLIVFLEKLRRILNITNDYCALNNLVFCFENGFFRVKPS